MYSVGLSEYSLIFCLQASFCFHFLFSNNVKNMLKSFVLECHWFFIIFSALWKSLIWISMVLIRFTWCWFCDLLGFEFFSDSAILSLPYHIYLPFTSICWLFSYLNLLIQSPSWFYWAQRLLFTAYRSIFLFHILFNLFFLIYIQWNCKFFFCCCFLL